MYSDAIMLTSTQTTHLCIHVGKFKGATSDNDLSLDDLSELLHSVDHDKVVNSDGQIISDEALAALLDRTVRTKPVTVSPDQGSDTSKVAGEGTSHSGVFKVLEEIGNVVHSKEESEDKKGSGTALYSVMSRLVTMRTKLVLRTRL